VCHHPWKVVETPLVDHLKEQFKGREFEALKALGVTSFESKAIENNVIAKVSASKCAVNCFVVMC
jgi:hypothetical protein